MNINRVMNKQNFVLACILIIGFYLRICNIDYALPYIYNHDGLNIVEQALKFGRGTLEPFGFRHGVFLSYILFFEYVVYFLLNLLISKMLSPIDLLREYILNPSVFFIIGRVTVAFFSMGSLFLVYLICKRFFGEKTGLIAALFTSVSFNIIYMSHYVKQDIIAGFFILYSFYFASKALNESYSKSLYISALLIGIAISAKYYSFIGISFIFLVLALKIKSGEISFRVFLKVFLQCIFISTFIFLILNPYIIIQFKRFTAQIFSLKGGYSISYGLYDKPAPWLYLLFLKEGVGWPIFYLYFLSLFFIFSNRNILLCNLYPLLLYIFLCFFKRGGPWFLASIIPFVSISSAFLIVRFVSFFVKKRIAQGAVIFFMAVIFSLSTFTLSWKYCSLLKAEDTRELAKRWIESNIKPDSSILVGGSYTFNVTGGGPPLRENINTLKRELREVKETGGSGFLWENKMNCITAEEGPLYELCKTMFISLENIKGYNTEYVILDNYCEHFGILQFNVARDYLKDNYTCIKRITPDVYIEFFPSFESLCFGAFEVIEKISFSSLSTLRTYGPVIEIYKRR